MLAIQLLGALRVEQDGRPLKFAGLPRIVPLWAWLLLNRAQPVSRSRLAGILWPDVGEEEARTNLRRHLYELRRLLPPAPDDCPWVLADAAGVQWNPAAPYTLDVEQFERLAREPATLRDLDALRHAVALYRGDLLADQESDLFFFERERLRSLYHDLLARAVAECRARGDTASALEYAERALQQDPLREEIVREVMSLRADAGDRTGALHAYRRFEQLLRDEMDVAPAVETSALYDAIARQLLPRAGEAPAPEIAAAPEAAPARAAGPPTNLPAQLTSFVGREAELAALRTRLTHAGDARLLTLTGPGGSGKSRLALEAGARLLAEQPPPFPDGVFAVMLAAATDAQQVAPLIVRALGVKEQPGRAADESLHAWLADRSLLLILDNFEHVAAAAPLVAHLLERAPRLRLLVTSRAPLRVYGEHEFDVPPLPLPEPDEFNEPETLARYASVNLFLTRSRAVRASFALTADNAAAVAELCTRLDGLPLALELAAARSKLFSPQAMLAHLRDQLTFFTDARLPPRQRTMRTALDWSYNLLAPGEQRLLARLSVFARRFSLEAAEAVCAFDGDLNVLDLLPGLVDHSLVQQVESDAGGDVLLSMLALVRQYAAAQLPPDEETRLRMQHARYYNTLVQQAYAAAQGASYAQWVERLAADDENIVAALDWCLRAEAEPAQAALGGGMALALERYWQVRGLLPDGHAWIRRAIDHRAHIDPDTLTSLLNLSGSYAAMQGDLAAALDWHQQALAQVRLIDNPRKQAVTQHFIGLTVARSGDLARGDALLTDCLALYRRTPTITSVDLSALLNNLAIVATRLGDHDRAVELLVESEGLARARGDNISLGHVLTSLGDLKRLQGDLAAATEYHRQAMQVHRTLNNQLGMLATVQSMANLAFAGGQDALAVRLCAAADALRTRMNASLTGHNRSEFDATLAALRARLDAREFDRLWAVGAGLALDDAARLALTIA